MYPLDLSFLLQAHLLRHEVVQLEIISLVSKQSADTWKETHQVGLLDLVHVLSF